MAGRAHGYRYLKSLIHFPSPHLLTITLLVDVGTQIIAVSMLLLLLFSVFTNVKTFTMDNALINTYWKKTHLLYKTNNNDIKCLFEINFLFIKIIHLHEYYVLYNR
jgi:hypothetical protein